MSPGAVGKLAEGGKRGVGAQLRACPTVEASCMHDLEDHVTQLE